jgi:Na+-driven multidrug efflux pump
MSLVMIVATIGTAALAAQQISFTAMSLGFLPAIGFAVTATALVGQSIGARRIDDALTAFRISLRWSIVWMVGGLVLYVLAAEWMIKLFSSDPEVIAAGTGGLRAIGLSLPLWGIWMTSAGSLRGSGDTRSPMVRGVITVWLAVVLAFVGVHWFDMGIGWVWLTFLITSPISAVGNIRAFRRRSEALRHEFALDPNPESPEPIPVPVYHP